MSAVAMLTLIASRRLVVPPRPNSCSRWLVVRLRTFSTNAVSIGFPYRMVRWFRSHWKFTQTVILGRDIFLVSLKRDADYFFG